MSASAKEVSSGSFASGFSVTIDMPQNKIYIFLVKFTTKRSKYEKNRRFVPLNPDFCVYFAIIPPL